jgi:hypothetical protein
VTFLVRLKSKERTEVGEICSCFKIEERLSFCKHAHCGDHGRVRVNAAASGKKFQNSIPFLSSFMKLKLLELTMLVFAGHIRPLDDASGCGAARHPAPTQPPGAVARI